MFSPRPGFRTPLTYRRKQSGFIYVTDPAVAALASRYPKNEESRTFHRKYRRPIPRRRSNKKIKSDDRHRRIKDGGGAASSQTVAYTDSYRQLWTDPVHSISSEPLQSPPDPDPLHGSSSTVIRPMWSTPDRPNRPDLQPNRPDLQSNRPDLQPNRPDLQPNRPDLQPNRLDRIAARPLLRRRHLKQQQSSVSSTSGLSALASQLYTALKPPDVPSSPLASSSDGQQRWDPPPAPSYYAPQFDLYKPSGNYVISPVVDPYAVLALLGFLVFLFYIIYSFLNNTGGGRSLSGLAQENQSRRKTRRTRCEEHLSLAQCTLVAAIHKYGAHDQDYF